METVRQVAAALNVEVTVRAAATAPWHPGGAPRCSSESRSSATPVSSTPKVCVAFGLPSRSAAAEIDLDLLMSHAAPPAAPVFSTFPVAKEDVALVVEETVTAAELAATLRAGAGELLESVRLFDLYTGEQIGRGRKSLAFALRFRAPDRTLTVEETSSARDAAVALAARRHGAVQRA